MQVVRTTRFYQFLLAALVLCAFELAIVNLVFVRRLSDLAALAVTADLVLGIPVLFYLFVSRKNRLSPVTLLPVLLVAVILANAVLPPDSRSYSEQVATLVPFAVLALGAVEGVRAYRRTRPHTAYPLDALELTLKGLIGSTPVTTLLATELAAWYYSLAGWFFRWQRDDPNLIPFSYHHKTPYPMFLAALMPIVLVESVLIHLLIQHWSTTLAWVATGLNAYTLIWVFADFNAIRLNPVLLGPDTLHIRIGLRWHAAVTLANIQEARPITVADKERSDFIGLAVSTDERFVLCLNEPVLITGFLGRRRVVRIIGLALDDDRQFLSMLQKSIANAPRQI